MRYGHEFGVIVSFFIFMGGVAACTSLSDRTGVENNSKSATDKQLKTQSCYASCYDDKAQEDCSLRVGVSASYDACNLRNEDKVKQCKLRCDVSAQQLKK